MKRPPSVAAGCWAGGSGAPGVLPASPLPTPQPVPRRACSPRRSCARGLSVALTLLPISAHLSSSRWSADSHKALKTKGRGTGPLFSQRPNGRWLTVKAPVCALLPSRQSFSLAPSSERPGGAGVYSGCGQGQGSPLLVTSVNLGTSPWPLQASANRKWYLPNLLPHHIRGSLLSKKKGKSLISLCRHHR